MPRSDKPLTTQDLLNRVLPLEAALADALANPSLTQLATFPHLFDGTNWQRARGNGVLVTQLASASRTASTDGPDQINQNGSGVYIRFNITTAGTGTLTLIIKALFGTATFTILTSAAFTTAADRLFHLYPGIGAASGDLTAIESRALPRDWRIRVAHSDASGWTYVVESLTIR